MSIVNAVNADPINDEDGRISVINDDKGAKVNTSNQCGDFKFDLYKAPDPRTDPKALADYDNKIYAYVGPRHWAKHKFPKDYTNPAQLKFSNIKLPGGDFLVDMKWWLDYEVKINFKDFPWPVSNAAAGTIDVNDAKKISLDKIMFFV